VVMEGEEMSEQRLEQVKTYLDTLIKYGGNFTKAEVASKINALYREPKEQPEMMICPKEKGCPNKHNCAHCHPHQQNSMCANSCEIKGQVLCELVCIPVPHETPDELLTDEEILDFGRKYCYEHKRPNLATWEICMIKDILSKCHQSEAARIKHILLILMLIYSMKKRL
jgi:hypothetical protein